MNKNQETCCSPFDPASWDKKEVHWEEKPFVLDRVRSLFHIPLNFSQVMKRNVGRIEAAGAESAEMMVLCDENSPWGADVYISVAKDVPDASMVTLSGTFLSRVFEGPCKDMRQWMADMHTYVASQGKQPQRVLCYYTTCPACAKTYGKNYVVLLAHV